MKKLLLLFSLFVFFSCSTEEEEPTLETTTYTLNADANPSDAGTITPSSGEYKEGETVEITALPIEGWEFKEWSGDLSGTENPTKITMSSNKTIKANFGRGSVFYINNGSGQIYNDYALIDRDNIIITGKYNNPEQDLSKLGFVNNSTFNSYIINISTSGQIKWGNAVNTNVSSLSAGVLKSSNGDYVRWGIIPDEGETNVNGLKDIFIQRFGESGDEIFFSRIGGSGKENVAPTAIENNDGTLEFTGSTESRDRDFDNIQTPEVLAHILIKTNSSGELISAFDLNEGKINSQNSNEWIDIEGREIIELSNSNKLIVGGDKNRNEDGVAMALFDNQNNLIWKKFYKTDIFLFGYNFYGNVLELPDANLILRTSYNVNGAKNTQITKMSPEGNLIWEKKMIEQGHINDMIINDSEILLAGYEPEFAFVRSFDFDGNLKWEKQYEGKNVYLRTIVKNNSEYVLMGNTKENTGIFSDNPIESGDFQNLFFINIDFEGNIK